MVLPGKKGKVRSKRLKGSYLKSSSNQATTKENLTVITKKKKMYSKPQVVKSSSLKKNTKMVLQQCAIAASKDEKMPKTSKQVIINERLARNAKPSAKGNADDNKEILQIKSTLSTKDNSNVKATQNISRKEILKASTSGSAKSTINRNKRQLKSDSTVAANGSFVSKRTRSAMSERMNPSSGEKSAQASAGSSEDNRNTDLKTNKRQKLLGSPTYTTVNVCDNAKVTKPKMKRPVLSKDNTKTMKGSTSSVLPKHGSTTTIKLKSKEQISLVQSDKDTSQGKSHSEKCSCKLTELKSKEKYSVDPTNSLIKSPDVRKHRVQYNPSTSEDDDVFISNVYKKKQISNLVNKRKSSAIKQLNVVTAKGDAQLKKTPNKETIDEKSSELETENRQFHGWKANSKALKADAIAQLLENDDDDEAYR